MWSGHHSGLPLIPGPGSRNAAESDTENGINAHARSPPELTNQPAGRQIYYYGVKMYSIRRFSSGKSLLKSSHSAHYKPHRPVDKHCTLHTIVHTILPKEKKQKSEKNYNRCEKK